jgi:acyl CoA:acetate/3-ketoacid CoA transferase alpha subunit
MDVIQSGIGSLIQPVDLPAFRQSNRQKEKGLVDKRMTEAQAVQRFIQDGMYIGTELYGTVRCPMSLISEIIRQGIRDLRVAGQGVLELDMLLGAGLIKALDLTYVGLEVYGVSNCLRREVESGRLEPALSGVMALVWRFAAAAGIPFMARVPCWHHTLNTAR